MAGIAFLKGVNTRDPYSKIIPAKTFAEVKKYTDLPFTGAGFPNYFFEIGRLVGIILYFYSEGSITIKILYLQFNIPG